MTTQPHATQTLNSAGQLVGAAYKSSTGALKAEFLDNDFVPLPAFVAPQALEWLRGWFNLMEASARPRDFTMEEYDSPRLMSVLGGYQIAANFPDVSALYYHHELRRFVESVTGGDVHDCPDAHEFMVANIQSGIGQTHGWHLDDPTYALVIVVDAPAPGTGGHVEYIPEWPRRRAAFIDGGITGIHEQVGLCVTAGHVRAYQPHCGDAYFLRAESALHRVAELGEGSGKRRILNIAFDDVPDKSYGSTAATLYG